MSKDSRNAKINSKDNKESKKKVNPKSFQSDDSSDSNNLGNYFRDILGSINRNRSTSFIVFSIAFTMFLVVYFQVRYDQQQRYSPDRLKEDQDVSSYYNRIIGRSLGNYWFTKWHRRSSYKKEVSRTIKIMVYY